MPTQPDESFSRVVALRPVAFPIATRQPTRPARGGECRSCFAFHAVEELAAGRQQQVLQSLYADADGGTVGIAEPKR